MVRAALAVALFACAVVLVSATERGPWSPIGKGVGGTSGGPSGFPIPVGSDTQTVINSQPAGTTFLFKAGIHRQANMLNPTFTPRNGDVYIGETGAIISGAKLLSSPSGSNPWAYSGQTQRGDVAPNTPADGAPCGQPNSCACQHSDGYYTAHPECVYPEDLFFDNVPKARVLTFGAGGAGKWFFDFGTSIIYVWDNPSGHVVETSAVKRAWNPTAQNVDVSGLIIEKYMATYQEAAIYAGTGWVVHDNEVRYNHAGGITNGSNSTVRNNRIHHNGEIGLIGSGIADFLVEGNEIYFNNYGDSAAGTGCCFFDGWWEAGGSKWAFATNGTIRGNISHHNGGPGLWTDINNIGFLYDSNTIYNNLRGGIFHEISYQAEIKNNVIYNNGNLRNYSWASEGCIGVVDSPNVEIHHNTCTDNYAGIGAFDDTRSVANDVQTHGVWNVHDLNIHDNTINSLTNLGLCCTGPFAGSLIAGAAGNGIFTSRNNHWTNNTYHLGSYASVFFNWNSTWYTINDWHNVGNDTTSGGSTTVIGTDTFAGTNGTNLTAHVGELGANWNKATGQTGNFVLTGSSAMRQNSVGLGTVYYASAAPSSNQYTVSTNFVINTTIADAYFGLWCRMGTDATGYVVQWETGNNWTLSRIDAGFVPTLLGAYGATYADGTTVTVSLSCQNSFKSVSLNGFPITGLSSGDNAITQVGKGGFSSYAPTVAPTNSTGVHFKAFSVTE